MYASNLSLSVTSEKLEGLFEDEADCNVKEVFLVKVRWLGVAHNCVRMKRGLNARE